MDETFSDEKVYGGSASSFGSKGFLVFFTLVIQVIAVEIGIFAGLLLLLPVLREQLGYSQSLRSEIYDN